MINHHSAFGFATLVPRGRMTGEQSKEAFEEATSGYDRDSDAFREFSYDQGENSINVSFRYQGDEKSQVNMKDSEIARDISSVLMKVEEKFYIRLLEIKMVGCPNNPVPAAFLLNGAGKPVVENEGFPSSRESIEFNRDRLTRKFEEDR